MLLNIFCCFHKFATLDRIDEYFDYQVKSYCPNIYIYFGLRFNKGSFKQEKVPKHFDFEWTFFYFCHWDYCWHSHTSDGSKKWTHIWINILCSLGYCVFHSSNCIVFSCIPRTAQVLFQRTANILVKPGKTILYER